MSYVVALVDQLKVACCRPFFYRPLPHTKYRTGWRPPGNPSYARDFLEFPQHKQECQTGRAKKRWMSIKAERKCGFNVPIPVLTSGEMFRTLKIHQ